MGIISVVLKRLSWRLEVSFIVVGNKHNYNISIDINYIKKHHFIQGIIWRMLRRFGQKRHFIFCGGQIYSVSWKRHTCIKRRL